jgi:hypothetical protein
MPSGEGVVGRVRDRDGREVVLLARIWEEKISRDHPELGGHLEAVLSVVQRPDHVEHDVLPERWRYYARLLGPSRWLAVVVSY